MASVKRAYQVCSACHGSKVRCEYNTALGCCTYCQVRGLKCELRTRKPYSSVKRIARKPKKSKTKTPAAVDTASHSTDAIANIVSSIFPQPGLATISMYTGDTGYGALLDILGTGEAKPRHITIKSVADTATTLDQEELRYLQAKGCFELPSESEELVLAYFKFVHPLFPILDGPSFLSYYFRHGVESVNLLLLWSMFSVSSSFTPSVSSRTIRRAFHARGSALFYHGGETDKLVLTQTALLLSFWFDDARDVKESWYWSGIAFSLAHTLGLHIVPETDTGSSSETVYDVRDDVWHCCKLRDSWLSYSMGRPLRLTQTQRTFHDTAHGQRFRKMSWYGQDLFTDNQASILDMAWQRCLAIAHRLRLALSVQTVQTTCESTPREYHLIQEEVRSSLPVSLCIRHLRLCEHAAALAVRHLSQATDNMDIIADSVATIVENYGQDHDHDQDNGPRNILTAPPMFVPLILPALLVSVAGIKSTSTTLRDRSQRRLKVLLNGLSRVESSYPAATIVRRLFTKVSTALDEVEV